MFRRQNLETLMKFGIVAAIAALIRLIEDVPITADLGIKSASQEQGAIIYRNWLRKRYQTKRVEEIKETLQ